MRLALLLAAWLLMLDAARAAEPPVLRVDPAWPRPLPHGWVLGEVAGVAVDAADNVWIIQRPDRRGGHAAPPVIQFDPAGNLLRAWGGPGPGYDWFQSEHGVHVDAQGFVWLGGNGAHDGQVLKFTPDGKFLLQIGRPAIGAASNDTTRLGRPADVAVDTAAHEVFIADGYANRRIIVFDSLTGAYRRHWGAYGGRPQDIGGREQGAAPRQFGTPVHCVKLARDGLLYVCDRQNDRIQVFQKNGNFVTEWRIAPETRGMGSIWDLAFSADADQSLLFGADGTAALVRVLRRADGTVLGAFGHDGREPGAFHWLHSIAADSHGIVFTTEVDAGRRVQRFVPAAP